MNKTLLKIKNEYDALGKAEKKIADVLQNNDKSVPSMFIGDFAKLCDCSVATVTRFSKKLGFNGFPQLKIALAREKDFPPSEKILLLKIPPQKFLLKFVTTFTVPWKGQKKV